MKTLGTGKTVLTTCEILLQASQDIGRDPRWGRPVNPVSDAEKKQREAEFNLQLQARMNDQLPTGAADQVCTEILRAAAVLSLGADRLHEDAVRFVRAQSPAALRAFLRTNSDWVDVDLDIEEMTGERCYVYRREVAPAARRQARTLKRMMGACKSGDRGGILAAVMEAMAGSRPPSDMFDFDQGLDDELSDSPSDSPFAGSMFGGG